MRRDRFIESREKRWRRLEDLTRRAGAGGLGGLSGDEVLELGQLYRVATSDLALARRDFPADSLTIYLNRLVGGAYGIIYRPGGAKLRQIGVYIRYGFPAAWRETLPYTAIAFALFVLSAVISGALVLYHPPLADAFIGDQAAQLRGVMEHHHLWMKANTANHLAASNFIMTNNIKVAFLAFAGGVLVGVGSAVLMIYNGINIGVVGAMVAQYHLSDQLWSFVAPHGVIELSVVFMAGGAGLMLGDAILRPGLARRRDALAVAARRAAYLIIGCVPLLVIAGTIEGNFSPSDAPEWSKFLFGACTGVLLYWYLLFSRPAVRPATYAFHDVFVPTAAITEASAP